MRKLENMKIEDNNKENICPWDLVDISSPRRYKYNKRMEESSIEKSKSKSKSKQPTFKISNKLNYQQLLQMSYNTNASTNNTNNQ